MLNQAMQQTAGHDWFILTTSHPVSRRAGEFHRSAAEGVRVAEFVIDGTNFGVDADKSSFKLLTKPQGRIVLDIEINGDQSAYDAASSVEDWKWSWTMYPPRFYLFTEVECASEGQNLTVEFTAAEIESAEMAVYMMNHNHVADVIVRIEGNQLSVSGRVDMMGQPAAFRIDWLRNPDATPRT